jgi:hypothetical protein
MDIRINILEVASELADRDLMISYGDTSGRNIFPNGILLDMGDETSYTDEAQDYFNERYDFWWDFLYALKVSEYEE